MTDSMNPELTQSPVHDETGMPVAGFPPPSTEPTADQMVPEEIRLRRASLKPLFNLDELENEKTSEPFVFEFGGDVFELLDPKDIDWQDLLVIQENPRLTLHVIMPEDQRAQFLEKKLPMRKFEVLLNRWQQHFGLPTPGEDNGSAGS
jgi:hypothetical protein